MDDRLPQTIEEADGVLEALLGRIAAEPGYLPLHEAAYRTALNRKVLGGRSAGAGMRRRGGRASTSVERLIAAERRWLLDPTNGALALGVLKQAAALRDESRPEGLAELAAWLEPFSLRR